MARSINATMVAAMIKFYKIALSNSQKSMANVKKKCWSELNFKERERERNNIPSRAPRLVYRYHVETIYINGKLIKLHVLHVLLLIIELVQRVADTACYYLCMQHSIFDNEKQNLQRCNVVI